MPEYQVVVSKDQIDTDNKNFEGMDFIVRHIPHMAGNFNEKGYVYLFFTDLKKYAEGVVEYNSIINESCSAKNKLFKEEDKDQAFAFAMDKGLRIYKGKEYYNEEYHLSFYYVGKNDQKAPKHSPDECYLDYREILSPVDGDPSYQGESWYHEMYLVA